jgi:hypothetical protein
MQMPEGRSKRVGGTASGAGSQTKALQQARRVWRPSSEAEQRLHAHGVTERPIIAKSEEATHKCRIEQTEDVNDEVERHRVSRSKVSVAARRIRSALDIGQRVGRTRESRSCRRTRKRWACGRGKGMAIRGTLRRAVRGRKLRFGSAKGGRHCEECSSLQIEQRFGDDRRSSGRMHRLLRHI